MVTKPKAIITIGVSGSGKTTWASKQNDYFNLCRDDIRKRICMRKSSKEILNQNMWSIYKWKWEKETSELHENHLSNLIGMRANAIISDTNLNPKYRSPLIERLKAAGYDVEIKEFPIRFDDAVKNDLKRLNSVGKDVIYKQWLQWQAYLNEEGQVYEPNIDLPNAIICDIDGTLAHMGDRRSPFEWCKVGLDQVDRDVAFIISQYQKVLGMQVILLSGRDSVCRKETEQWLFDNHINYDHLFMRPEGNNQKDTIIKRELFDKYVRDKYNVALVIDDRPQVLRLWLDLGLKTLAVGNPFLEF